MSRLVDWDTYLDRFLAARLDDPHQWGVNDCVLFAADAIQAMTGTDPLPPHGRGYKTEDEALALLEHDYDGSLMALADDLFGTPTSRLNAQRGDIAAGRWGVDDELVLGVVTAGGVASPGRYGLCLHDRQTIVRCWHG